MNWLQKMAVRYLGLEEAVGSEVSYRVEKVKAQLGFSHRLTNGDKWVGGLPQSGVPLIYNHRGLRTNARRAYFDSPIAKGLVDRFADSQADCGLKLEASPNADVLGISLEEAQIWSAIVEGRFDLWARSKRQHRAEAMTFYQSHRLLSIAQHRDNDYFVRFYYEPRDRSLLSPLQFSFIDPDQIVGDTSTSTMGAHFGNTGIRTDERGREVDYSVRVQKADGSFEYIIVPRVGKSGRVMMLHGFTPEYVGQVRGYPRISHVIQEFSQLTNFSVAHIQKAINQANIAVQNTNNLQDPSNPVEEMMTAGAAGPILTDSAPPPTEGNPAGVETIEYYPLPEARMNTPGSLGVFNLRMGDKVSPFDSTAPASTYDAFTSAFAASLTASTGMPLEALLIRFNNSYSASRAALIMFWRICGIWREEMAADYLDPTYEAWLSEEIAWGRVAAPGWSDPVLRAAWLGHSWIGPPMPNIDPSKTAKADQMYVEMGAQTLDRTARNHNGSSGRSNRARLAREFSELPESPFKAKTVGR